MLFSSSHQLRVCNDIIMLLSDVFPQNLMFYCIFSCLIVLHNFIQKSTCIAEIPTKVTGGYFLCSPCILVCHCFFFKLSLLSCKLNASVTLNDLEQSCRFSYDSLRL